MAISSPPRRGGQAAPRRRRGLITALVVALVAVLVLAAVVVALLARGGSLGTGVQGSGVAATQARVLAMFSSLDLAGSNNVTVSVGGRQAVVVHADSNLMRYVTTRVVAGTLVIGTTGTSGSGLIRVTATASLNAAVSGSGAIIYSGNPQVTSSVTGSGTVTRG